MALIHWGVSDGSIVQTWHNTVDLDRIQNHWKQANPNIGKTVKPEVMNGHIPE